MASIRPLDDQLEKIAREELNENSDRLADDLRTLKAWLNKQDYLKSRTDDQFLVTFLRGCKHSLEKTKFKIDKFYSVRTSAPELFSNRDPLDPVIADVIKHQMFVPLPKVSSVDGARLFVFRPGRFDVKSFSLEDVMKVFFLGFDIMFTDDDNVAVAGQRIIFDIGDMTVSHIMQMTPTLVRRSMTLMQDASPLRLKGFHFVNMSLAFETALKLVKSFMSEKSRNRTHVHSILEDLHMAIPKELLPTEYGGEAGSITIMASDFEKKIIKYRDYLMDEVNYHTDEKRRPKQPNYWQNTFGMEGFIRKLEVN